MSRKWFSVIVLIAVAAFLFSLSSCAFNQHLTSIQVQPSAGDTFFTADPSLFFDFKAFGTYIHPPHTADITDQVTWQTDNPQVVQVTSSGVVSPSLGCGLGNVFATLKDGSNLVVSNSVPVTVDGPASLGCPQSGATHNLSVNVTSGGANGVIVSSPAGINCGTTCSAAFAVNSSVALTPTPITPHTFGGWVNCTTTSGTTCNVTMTTDVTVDASFN
jgi:Divergent InlB B-repeat domain